MLQTRSSFHSCLRHRSTLPDHDHRALNHMTLMAVFVISCQLCFAILPYATSSILLTVLRPVPYSLSSRSVLEEASHEERRAYTLRPDRIGGLEASERASAASSRLRNDSHQRQKMMVGTLRAPALTAKQAKRLPCSQRRCSLNHAGGLERPRIRNLDRHWVFPLHELGPACRRSQYVVIIATERMAPYLTHPSKQPFDQSICPDTVPAPSSAAAPAAAVILSILFPRRCTLRLRTERLQWM